MNKDVPFINKFVKLKEKQITDVNHYHKMRMIKSVTTKLMEHNDNIIINKSKRQMQNETRFTEIQRQNRILLEKISTMMKKSPHASVKKNFRSKVNKSLNEIHRKHQMQNIEVENAKLLKRLQQKKPIYNVSKLRKQWQDTKDVLKRMSNYNFHITNITPGKSRGSCSSSDHSNGFFKRNPYQKMSLIQQKVIDGVNLLIRIEFVDKYLKIVGDAQDKKDLKIIDIPKDEAIQFIQLECNRKFENILDKLRYDVKEETLYLMGNENSQDLPFLQDQDQNPEIKSKRFDIVQKKFNLKNSNSQRKQEGKSLSSHEISQIRRGFDRKINASEEAYDDQKFQESGNLQNKVKHQTQKNESKVKNSLEDGTLIQSDK